jgi:hypothetical protein
VHFIKDNLIVSTPDDIMNDTRNTVLFHCESIYNIISKSNDDNLTLAAINEFIISIVELFLNDNNHNNQEPRGQTHFTQLLKQSVNFHTDVIKKKNETMYGLNASSANETYLDTSESETEVFKGFNIALLSDAIKDDFCKNLNAWIQKNKQILSQTPKLQNHARSEEFNIAISLLVATIKES